MAKKTKSSEQATYQVSATITAPDGSVKTIEGQFSVTGAPATGEPVPPSIVSQPEDQIVVSGTSLTLSGMFLSSGLE